MAVKAPLKELRRFFRDTIGMNYKEANGYMTRLRDAGINTQERADEFLSHLKTKYEQGRVGGEHSDANLDDTLRNALGVKPYKNAGTGLGERIYSAGKTHTNLFDGNRLPTDAENKLNEYKASKLLERYNKAKKLYNSQRLAERMSTAEAVASEREARESLMSRYSSAKESAKARLDQEQKLRDDFAKAQAEEHAALTGADDVIKDQPTPTKPIPDKTVTPVNPPVVGGKAAANENLINIQEESARKFFENPANQGLAKHYNIEQNFEGMRRVSNIVRGVENAGPVTKMFATGGQKPLNVGSGKPLQEGTLSYTYDPEKVSDIEKMSSISDLGFSHMENGMKIAARELSIDEAKLKSLIKQNDMPGTKAANDMLYGRVTKGLKSDYTNIMKSDLSQEEKIAKWKTAREEAIERLRNGATFQDYFFGNRVHHGLAGMAAITGTLGVAFGGHKSNAELYSSPF